MESVEDKYKDVCCKYCNSRNVEIKRNESDVFAECKDCGEFTLIESEQTVSSSHESSVESIDDKYKYFCCEECGSDNVEIIDCSTAVFAECKNCGKTVILECEDVSPPPSTRPTVSCPYCQSTNTKKISGLSKAGSVAMWGIFAAGKVSKQWHCNNCKSNF